MSDFFLLVEREIDLVRCLAFLVDLNDADGNALHHFAIATDVDGVDAGFRETQALKIHDQIPCEERHLWWELHVKFWLDGHIFGVERLAIFIDDIDRELVMSAVFWSEAEAQGQRTMGLN